MRKGIKKLLTVALTATLGLAALAGCGSSSADGGSANGGTTKELSGKIQLAGSTSMEKMCGALMEAFMEEYPNVTVTTEYTGSGAGIESVTSGAVDIGNASRALSDKEKSAGIEENIVAIDGIAMITDKNNKVTNVTKQQLTDIYTGKITNWKEVGGADEAIVLITRPESSGTRATFKKYALLCLRNSFLVSAGVVSLVAVTVCSCAETVVSISIRVNILSMYFLISYEYGCKENYFI